MQIVTFHRPTFWAPHTYAPNTRYLINESMLNRMREKDNSIEARVSVYNAWERKYAGQDLSGKRLLMYRPKSIGDQLITSALVKYLKTLFPTCVIDYYLDPHVTELWNGIPINLSPTPITLDACQNCDYTLFLEGLYENNLEPDQDDCYTTTFRYAGFFDVPAEHKKPWMVFTEEELKRPAKAPETPYILVQWEASAIYRSYPPRELARLCAELAETYHVVLVGNNPYQYVHHKNVTDLRNRTKKFREIIPWVANAGIVLCPDSSVGHLAACFPEVPVVSLWGSYSPEDRVKWYPNHIPIVGAKEACRFAPCRHGLHREPPRNLCERSPIDNPNAWVCNTLKSIPAEFIKETLFNHIRK